MKKVFLLSFCIICLSINLLRAGDELRAGVISIKQLSPLTVEAQIELVVEIHADISDLDFCWGDGSCTNFPELTGTLNTFQGLKYYSFTTTHTYNELDTYYTTSIDHCCFDEDISNITNGGATDFSISTTIYLQEQLNTTPFYNQNLIEVGTVGTTMVMLGSEEDEEGDGFSNSLCTPENVLDFAALDIIPTSPVNLSSPNGILIWSQPGFNGNYIAQLCTDEIRNGLLISASQRIVCFMLDPGFMTSTQELSTANISLYPNPVVNDLSLENKGNVDTENAKILLINSLQQIVIAEQWDKMNLHTLSLDHLPKGIYVVLVLLESGVSYYEQVVVN